MSGPKSLWSVFVGILIVGLAGASVRTDDIAIGNAESRRRAAENGLRSIKEKSSADADRVRALYTEAAERQNAWLELTCAGAEGPTTPDSKLAADAASAALIVWVNARNEALGLAQLSPTVADATKRDISKNLVSITTSTWKEHHGEKPQVRSKAVTALRERLTWKSFSEISTPSLPGR